MTHRESSACGTTCDECGDTALRAAEYVATVVEHNFGTDCTVEVDCHKAYFLEFLQSRWTQRERPWFDIFFGYRAGFTHVPISSDHLEQTRKMTTDRFNLIGAERD